MFANETNLDDAIEIVDAAILAALVELETAEKAPRPVSVDGRNLRAIEAHDQAILAAEQSFGNFKTSATPSKLESR